MNGYFNTAHDILENDTAFINIPSTGLLVYDFNVNPIQIGSLTSYPFQGTNHSGWKQDNLYILADENHGYEVKLINATDINNLTIYGFLNSGISTSSIAHNIIIKDQFAYLNYGLQIFDISNPSSPFKIGYFDTYLPNNHNGYAGAWGVYPLLPSGNILISDIQSGLYVLKLDYDEITICESDSVLFNGDTISSAGHYYEFLIDSLGYSSIDITELSYHHPLYNYNTLNIPQGDSFFCKELIKIKVALIQIA